MSRHGSFQSVGSSWYGLVRYRLSSSALAIEAVAKTKASVLMMMMIWRDTPHYRRCRRIPLGPLNATRSPLRATSVALLRRKGHVVRSKSQLYRTNGMRIPASGYCDKCPQHAFCLSGVVTSIPLLAPATPPVAWFGLRDRPSRGNRLAAGTRHPPAAPQRSVRPENNRQLCGVA